MEIDVGVELLKGRIKSTYKNIKKLSSYQKDYDGFKLKYKELVDNFLRDLKQINELSGCGPKKRNSYKRLLYLTRFDLIIKPTTFRVKDVDGYYEIKQKLWQRIQSVKHGKNHQLGAYLYDINTYFNLAPLVFPDSGKKPRFELKFDNNQPFNFQYGTYGPVFVEKFTNDIFAQDWECKLAYEIYNSATFYSPDCKFGSSNFSTRCQYSFNQLELRSLLLNNILEPLTVMLSNQGYSLIVEKSFNLKTDLPEKSKLMDVSKFQLQLNVDIMLRYHKPISNINMAAFTILVCEPSCLKEYIRDFQDDKGKFSSRSNNFKNLMTQAFCQAVFVFNHFGMITDYNSFLLFKMDPDLKLENDIFNKKNKWAVNCSSGFHCEVVHLKDGLCLAKVASFISDNVKNVIDNSEECLIRQLKEFCLGVD